MIEKSHFLGRGLKKSKNPCHNIITFYNTDKLGPSDKPVISNNDISVRFDRTPDCSDDVGNFNISQLVVDTDTDTFCLNTDQEFTSEFVSDPLDPSDPSEWRIRTPELTHDDFCVVYTHLKTISKTKFMLTLIKKLYFFTL